HLQQVAREDRQQAIEKARTVARSAGNDDAAYVRSFGAALRGTTRPGVGVPDAAKRHVLKQYMLMEPASTSIFTDRRYAANARRPIESWKAIYYPASEPERITGGFPDDDDTFPYCVAVGSGRDGYCCTGTLIAPNVVVTAGHCYKCCNEQSDGQIHVGKTVS